MPPVCLVTGGAVRLGRAIVLGLAADGYDVVIHYNRSDGAAKQTLGEVQGLGRRATLHQADLSDPEAIEGLARATEEAYGRLDLLVNSASTYFQTELEDVPLDEWRQVMAVNVTAPFLLTNALWDLLRSSEGSVINMVDLSALQAWVHFPHHSVSKAALLQLTKVQAKAMAPEIRVNAIAPGNVLPPEDDTPERIEASRLKIPMGRIGHPDDVVAAVRLLVDADYMTGEVMVVDGGRALSG
ncbi:MAG: SDR family oxidoreductase [Longimicrobiales bacterium]